MIQEANLHWRYINTDSNLLLPWYTKPALEWLKKQDVSQWSVFEYGLGYSTLWWRANVEKVYGVDNILSWVKIFDCNYNDRSVCHATDKDSFVMAINGIPEKKFDCIVVDGEWREECVEFSRDYLKPGGFMIYDNYDQPDFPPSENIDELLKEWSKQIFKQPNHSFWKTAIFCKP